MEARNAARSTLETHVSNGLVALIDIPGDQSRNETARDSIAGDAVVSTDAQSDSCPQPTKEACPSATFTNQALPLGSPRRQIGQDNVIDDLSQVTTTHKGISSAQETSARPENHSQIYIQPPQNLSGLFPPPQANSGEPVRPSSLAGRTATPGARTPQLHVSQAAAAEGTIGPATRAVNPEVGSTVASQHRIMHPHPSGVDRRHLNAPEKPAVTHPQWHRTRLDVSLYRKAGRRPIFLCDCLNSSTLIRLIASTWQAKVGLSIPRMVLTYMWLPPSHPARYTLLSSEQETLQLRQLLIDDIPRMPPSNGLPWVVQVIIFAQGTSLLPSDAVSIGYSRLDPRASTTADG